MELPNSYTEYYSTITRHPKLLATLFACLANEPMSIGVAETYQFLLHGWRYETSEAIDFIIQQFPDNDRVKTKLVGCLSNHGSTAPTETIAPLDWED